MYIKKITAESETSIQKENYSSYKFTIILSYVQVLKMLRMVFIVYDFEVIYSKYLT